VRILMLGWEFPPFISGGLGTACYGLTRALDRRGHEIVFVLPKAVEHEHHSHVKLRSPDHELEARLARESPAGGPARRMRAAKGVKAAGGAIVDSLTGARITIAGFERTAFVGVPSAIRSPYPAAVGESLGPRFQGKLPTTRAELEALLAAGIDLPDDILAALAPLEASEVRMMRRSSDYGGDVLGDAHRYAKLVVHLCRDEPIDVIHAHDWMTYPAGMALARITGRPLVAHIHSTEFDRSGEHVHQPVYDIERRGMHAAIRVVAVSNYTKALCVERYGLRPDKVDVVYNGIECGPQPRGEDRIDSKDKIVLFLGRITMQKGPEYFVAAAKRVLEKIENVKFIVAGSGDMARRMIELAADMGIGHRVLFTGFLRGKDVQRVFAMADCYVMPSVSEPFGIAPLEAINNDVPVIISKQSGVSEVLTHALKVDFWDVDEIANKIVAVLRHPPLSQTLREHGMFEIRGLTWEGAALRCEQIYRDSIASLDAHPVQPVFAGMR